MTGRTFTIILFLAIVLAGLFGWKHFSTVNTGKDDLRELRSLIANAQSRLDRKKAEALAAQEKLDQVRTKLATATEISELEKEKASLTTEISRLESERALAHTKLVETGAQVRAAAAAAGLAWPDLALPNGQMITAVKIQKATDTDVSLAHSGGVAKLSIKDLPDDLKVRLCYDIPAAPSDVPQR